ncbi:MAG: FAD-dependent oxidoreductase [Oleispira sp.]
MQPSIEEDIAIIGAGMAGLHMALSLKDRGYKNVTIYEAADRVGGKCYTKIVEGCAIDFGAGIIPGESSVVALCERFNIELIPTELYGNYVSSGAVRKAGLKLTMALKFLDKIQMGKLRKLIDKFNVPDPLLDVNDKRWQELSLPLSLVLQREGLNLAAGFCNRILYTYGYGTADEIPAYYGFEFFRLWLDAFIGQKLYVAKRGYQALPLAMAEKGGLNIKLSKKVSDIQHNGNKVSCRFTDGSVVETDFLINSMPHGVLNRASPFAGINEFDYEVGLIEKQTSAFISEHLTESRPGHVNFLVSQPQAREESSKIKRKTKGKIKSSDRKNRELTSYYCAPNFTIKDHHLSADESAQLINRSLNNYYDLKQFRILDRMRWSYFPQLSPEAIAAGELAQIFCQQGEDRVWNIGSACSFETVVNVIDYNQKILNKFNLPSNDALAPALTA